MHACINRAASLTTYGADSAAALVSIAVLAAALAVSVLFVMRRPEPGRKPA